MHPRTLVRSSAERALNTHTYTRRTLTSKLLKCIHAGVAVNTAAMRAGSVRLRTSNVLPLWPGAAPLAQTLQGDSC